MRRAVVALALAAMALAVFVSTRPTEDAHAATTCTKHTKRIVKHVKRHGKRKKIVRFHPYWTCQETADPVAPVTPAPAPAPAPAPEVPSPQPEPEPNALSITTDDHKTPLEYAPNHKTRKAGRLTIQLNNLASEDEHNMDMERVNGETGELEGPVIAEVSAAGAGASAPVTVEVQPGTYRMWCTIGHHAEHGMTTEVTIE
jgi:type IV secretory pathway VirB10-like protein